MVGQDRFTPLGQGNGGAVSEFIHAHAYRIAWLAVGTVGTIVWSIAGAVR